MSLAHKILTITFPMLRATNKVCNLFNQNSDHRLRVLIYHDIEPREKDVFAKQLSWLAKEWTFVSPVRFAAMIARKEPINGNYLLISFDDGFVSNRIVAEEILNPMGIQGLFFVVSDFVAIESREESRSFIASNICPSMVQAEVPEHQCNMKWHDLEALLEQGHTIGGHTKTHARLSELADFAQLEEEIVTSANILENRLSIKVEHFAYTFGDLASFSQQALEVASRRFKYVYSGMRGDNALGGGAVLRRDSLSPGASHSLIGAFLEGGADFRYSKSRQLLDQWAENISR